MIRGRPVGWRTRAGLAVVLLLGVACRRRLPAGWTYVTRVTPTGATVVWTGGADVLECRGPDGGPLHVVSAEGPRGLRVARLAGLLPSSTYGCGIASGNRPRRLRFRTAPAGPVPFTFAAVGDTGDGSRAAAALARRILAGRPAFLVHLGDMAYPGGSARDYAAEFFRPYGRLLRRVPLMPTPGNHDLRPRSVYRDLLAGPRLGGAAAPAAGAQQRGRPDRRAGHPAPRLPGRRPGPPLAAAARHARAAGRPRRPRVRPRPRTGRPPARRRRGWPFGR